jgi:hypothetical protein
MKNTVKQLSNQQRGKSTYLIFTSSNGTTTKLSVAPAAQPVYIEIDWFIFFSPDKDKNVLPQKSFAALDFDPEGTKVTIGQY